MRFPPHDYFPEGSAHWFVIPDGKDAGKTMFFSDHQVGEGDPQATILFVHGNPESSYTYRHIRDALIDSKKSMRIVMMDHIGFGLSDQATFEMVDMHHSANLLQLVQHLDLRDVSLVVHDWGGPIGIGALSQEPERVKNLLVMNTTIFPMPSEGFTYANYPISWMPWAMTPKIVPDFLWGGVAGYVVSHAAPQGTVKFLANVAKFLGLFGARLIKKHTAEYVWSEQLRSTMNAKSSKRNVRQTPFWGHGYSYTDATHGVQDNRDYYKAMQAVVPEAWANIEVSGHFGQWDPCGKDEVIEQWLAALPKMADNLFKYPEVGHFVEEYKGPEMAASILKMNGL